MSDTSEIAKTLGIIFVGSIMAAAFAGFALLKFYEELMRGIREKNRLRIWSAFFGVSFLVLFFFFSMRAL